MFSLNYSHKVTLNAVPIPWMTRIELFTPDLEQFPIMYVHFLEDKKNNKALGEYNPDGKQRIFGFVLSSRSINLDVDGLCDLELEFVCNIPQKLSESYDQRIKDELSHRIGLADKVGYKDLTAICKNSPEALPLLQKIWKDKIQNVYGSFIPHGRIFDEMLGIVRFSASGNAPRLGKTSEFRMLYWYLKDLGEKVSLGESAKHLSFIEFYLIPCYEELLLEDFSFFNLFNKFYKSSKIFWNSEYSQSLNIGNNSFQYAQNVAMKAQDFDDKFSSILKPDDYDNISKLRQIFNRMPLRFYAYIWNLMTPIKMDYKKVFSNRNDFKDFYANQEKLKGSSAKVVACFLQQAFGVEAIPIDTWVKTFVYFPLGLKPKSKGSEDPNKTDLNKIYSDYQNLDKLEKLIWVSSMGNKTNKSDFLDILWCQRYGTDDVGKGPTRGANPLSCSQCSLRNECISYKSIQNEKIIVSHDLDLLKNELVQNNLFYGVLTSKGTPRSVYCLEGNNLKERDSHSGLDITISKTINDGVYELNTFVNIL
tara:strand:- start:1998 stop:3599 length:1602 start_codon:yes stop_codon:yes gene_type:complete